jgi:hypothetical protein
MRRLTRVTCGAALLAPLALAGCTAAGSANTAVHAALSSASPTPHVLTGSELKAMLVTDVPSGYSMDQTMVQDTGDQIQNASTGPVPGKADCTKLDTNAFMLAAGVTSISFAQTGFANASKTGTIAEEIDVFQGTDAQTMMARLAQVFVLCKTHTFTYQGTKATEHLVGGKLPALGPEAVKAVLTSPSFKGGTTLVAAPSGTAVATVFFSSPGADKGAAAVTIAGEILKKLAAAGK